MRVRPERASDFESIDRIERLAFARADEARLVRSVRTSASWFLSLVAVDDDRLVGHVLFSPVQIVGAIDAPPAVGLAPVAVLPEHQGRGVGSALVHAGLDRCRSMGWTAAFLLGDPAYYSRFGFRLAAAHGLHYGSHDFDSVFQLLELVPGALRDVTGWVEYDRAFAALADHDPASAPRAPATIAPHS